MKTRIPILIFLILFFFSPPLVHAQAPDSQLNLNTYYTSPYGSYFQVRLIPRNALSKPCDPNPGVGTIYVDDSSSGTPRLQYCHDSGGGTWGPIGGVWQSSENYIYTMADAVGIGTDSPLAKLHVTAGSNDARVRLDSSGAQIVGLELYQAGTQRGKMELDTSGNLALENPDAGKKLTLKTGDNPYLTLDNSTGSAGLNTDSPTAMLDIVKPPSSTAPYFRLNSSASAGGDKFEIANGSNDGRVYINTTSRPASRLFLHDSIGDLGLLRNNGGSYEDLYYTGGSGNVARFVNTSTSSSGKLVFDWASRNPWSQPNPLAELNNKGDLYVDKKIMIGKNAASAVEFQVHDPDGTDVTANPYIIYSDAGTVTGIDLGDPCEYIDDDTIGVMSTASYTNGGMHLMGLSDGTVIGLRLTGALGTSAPGKVAAVNMGGLMTTGGISNPSDARDILVISKLATNGTNYARFLANGHVGFGMSTSTGVITPIQTLHVQNIMKLQPLDSPPAVCNTSNPDTEGTVYVDSSGALCYCNGTGWLAKGGGSCN